MRIISYILSGVLCAGFMTEAFQRSGGLGGVAIETCAGKTIVLDLGPQNPDPPSPHKLKPCHAICCSDNEDET